jgi:hypothetical protein
MYPDDASQPGVREMMVKAEAGSPGSEAARLV